MIEFYRPELTVYDVARVEVWPVVDQAHKGIGEGDREQRIYSQRLRLLNQAGVVLMEISMHLDGPGCGIEGAGYVRR